MYKQDCNAFGLHIVRENYVTPNFLVLGYLDRLNIMMMYQLLGIFHFG